MQDENKKTAKTRSFKVITFQIGRKSMWNLERYKENIALYLESGETISYQQIAQSQAFQQALLNYQAVNTMQAIEQKARQPVITQPYPTRVDTYTNCNSGFGNTVTCNSSSNIR